MPDSMPESPFFEAANIMSSVEQHNLKLLKERVNALLENEYEHPLKNNLIFNFDRPQDLITSGIFSFLLKPASLSEILKGHTNAVFSVAFSPNSKLLASASLDNTIRLWNVPSSELNAELKGHEHWVSSVAFSPDGKSIVTGSVDRTVRTWSVANKQQVQTLTGHSHYVVSVSFSQNGNKLASAGFMDNTAIIWDVDSGAALVKLTHSQPVSSVFFSNDDQFVVTGCDDKIVRMFNAETGREEKRFEGHTDEINSVAFSFDGSMIVSGSKDNSVRLWDMASTKQFQQLDGHSNWVRLVAFSRDGKFIASGSADKTVCLWNAPSFFKIACEPKEDQEESRKRRKIDHK